MTGIGGITPEHRRALAEAAAEVARSGLVVGGAGNLSVRAGDRVLITPRRARLGAVDPAACVEVDLDDGTVAADHQHTSEPSSEAPLHRAVYAATDAGAVVHTHSPYATVLGTLVDEIPAVHYGLMAFGGPVRTVPFAVFGSERLARSVAAALDGRSAALLANHGAVVCAGTVERAVELAVELEWLCTVAYRALLCGGPALLTGDDLRATAEQSRALRYAMTGPA